MLLKARLPTTKVMPGTVTRALSGRRRVERWLSGSTVTFSESWVRQMCAAMPPEQGSHDSEEHSHTLLCGVVHAINDENRNQAVIMANAADTTPKVNITASHQGTVGGRLEHISRWGQPRRGGLLAVGGRFG